jgi:hypothetical protein
MDTRHPIKDTPEPTVLSVAFNNDCTRFACGLDDGLRSAYADVTRANRQQLTMHSSLSCKGLHKNDQAGYVKIHYYHQTKYLTIISTPTRTRSRDCGSFG